MGTDIFVAVTQPTAAGLKVGFSSLAFKSYLSSEGHSFVPSSSFPSLL